MTVVYCPYSSCESWKDDVCEREILHLKDITLDQDDLYCDDEEPRE